MKFWLTGKATVLFVTLAVSAVFVLSAAAVDQQGQEKKKTENTPPLPTKAARAPKAVVPAVPARPAVPASPVAGPKTYTNDDLMRMFGEAPSGPSQDSQPPSTPPGVLPPTQEGPAKTALEQMEEQRELQVEKEEKIAEAQKALAAAEQRVLEVERRGRAVRNPLLKRPSVSEEEHEDWDNLGAAERAARTDEDLKKAREDVETARRALEESRRTP